MTGPAPGWYVDPQGQPGQQRWWDGAAWTEHVQVAQAAPQAPSPAPRRPARVGEIHWGWWIVVAVGVVILIGTVAGSGGGSTSSPSSDAPAAQSFNNAAEDASNDAAPLPTVAPEGAVAGSLSRECDLKCTSPDAARRLAIGAVWCFWDGHDVKVHVRLRNPMNARVKLSVTAKYFIVDGGQHGTSFAGDIPLRLNAGQGRTFVANAGHPEGVADGTAIASCAPHLHDIDIG